MSTVLLNLSGGLDSSYALWKLLSDERDVLVHHVELRSHEGRQPLEKRAVQRVTQWLKGRGFKFEVVTTRFDYGNAGWITRDIEVVRFITGVLLMSPERQHIDTVVASGVAEDPDLSDEEKARIHSLLEGAARRPIALERPIRHMSKAEVLAAMPPQLAKLCWYCRTPKQGRPCGSCKTCHHVAEARKKNGR